MVLSKAAACLGALLQVHPQGQGVAMNSVQLQGAGAHPRALCTSSSISASVSLTMTISRCCPLRAISHGPSFSIRIPASFLTFLVTPWNPESMRCILDIPPGAHALSKEPGPSPGGGRQPVSRKHGGLPKTEARRHSGKPALQFASGVS